MLLVAFLIVELVQKRPMVDFTLFAQSTFLGSAFATLGYAGGAQVMIFYLPPNLPQLGWRVHLAANAYTRSCQQLLP